MVAQYISNITNSSNLPLMQPRVVSHLCQEIRISFKKPVVRDRSSVDIKQPI